MPIRFADERTEVPTKQLNPALRDSDSMAELVAKKEGRVVEMVGDDGSPQHPDPPSVKLYGEGAEQSPEIIEAVRQPREIKLNACWCRTCFAGQTNHSFDEYALY